MLSNDELRRLLKRPDLNDVEAERIARELSWLADALIDDYLASSDTREKPREDTHDQRSDSNA